MSELHNHDWRAELHSRLAQIQQRKDQNMAKSAAEQVEDAGYVADVADTVDAPPVYEVVNLGWGVMVGSVVIHTGTKGSCIGQARAEAKEQGGEVVIKTAAGNLKRREYYQ